MSFGLFNPLNFLDMEFDEPIIKANEILERGDKISVNTSYLDNRFGDVLIDKNKVFNTLVTRNRYFF